MKYRGYLQSKDDESRQYELVACNTPNGAMYRALTAYARATLDECSPFVTPNWRLLIDRDGKLAYEFSVEEGDWVDA